MDSTDTNRHHASRALVSNGSYLFDCIFHLTTPSTDPSLHGQDVFTTQSQNRSADGRTGENNERDHLGMRIIKIHAWESPFTKLVEESRRCETRQVHFASVMRSFNVTLYDLGPRIVAFTTFTVYGAMGNPIVTPVVFPL
ncbi:putative multidrug resistance-associated protein 4 isoform X3 [Apostichopus japonicus]|uniref:Putative multidrug resistance-associated protein 4 isoform X3 n=1 Tax=Stichopus japonicus TaxID=307972 RepID=A0A2G8JPF4_STIJA|nr:putative multidrug resistance-associated protein 4 isoform X3 [Apostichopus japonicus]